MSLNATGSLALDTVRAALTVMRWSVGMMLLGGLASAISGAVLLDEAISWVRSGALGKLSAALLVLVLLVLPWIWSWLGRAHGIRKAAALMLDGRAETAIAYLLRAIARGKGSDAAPEREVSPQLLINALRRPSTLSGPARWVAWLVRWQLDLDRTMEHLQQAEGRALLSGTPPANALAQALAADLGERWLNPDSSLLWALAAAQVIVVSALAWFW